MSRKETKDQNDISLIIGNLPKRLQNKFAASCSNNSHAAEDAENAEPKPTATVTSRPVKVLSKPKGNFVSNTTIKVSAPVSDTSGCSISKSLEIGYRDTGIPGILRVKASLDTKEGDGAKKERGGRARRRRRTSSARMHQEQIPLSPLPMSRMRLTTEHPVWFEQILNMPNAKIIVQLYDQLMVLQQRNLILINWKNFCDLHAQLLNAYCFLLLEQLKFVCEYKVDTFFWKLLFYNVREYLKRQQTDVAQSHMLKLIDQTIKFYRASHEELLAKYVSTRCESAAKVVTQRLLICLGDLSRYRANHLQLTDFTEACKYYQRAQELVPNNGAPYNQLAIIAIYNHKRFEAVYYYMRSLLTSNAIQSAKESLLDLFDEIRRKYEETEMKQSPIHCANSNKPKKSKQLRREIWIYPDGMRRLHRTDVKGKSKSKSNIVEVKRYDEMLPDDLMPKVLTLYLYLIGKLFTATDIECMYQQLGKLHVQLVAALKHDNLLSRTKLLKMVALNVFILEHNKSKANRREMRYHSFNFANSLFGLIVSKANQLLASLTLNSNELRPFADNELTLVNTYLQFIKIYTQWLTLNVDVWEPVRTEDHSFIDYWSELQTLFDNIENIFSKLDVQNESRPHVLLEEDLVLSGFEPLGLDLTKECSKRGSEREQFVERIRKIAQFQDIYIKHQESLQLSFDDSFIIEDLNAAMQVALNDFDVSNCSDTTPVQTCASEPGLNDEENLVCFSIINADVSQLCKLKKQLEAKAKVKQICNSKLEDILKLVDSKLYIEVRPRYLLPDTNCFIDCLEDIEKLSMEFKRYTLIIPLTVVKELDGLSKGVKLDSYRSSRETQRIHHFDEVSTRAKKSLEFIRSAKSNVKCVTTKGSVISASLFALVEEEYASNDDKILATAVAVSKNASTEQCRDGKCFIRTELVLITTDRNLRVKALARNLAVSALDEFLKWAKDCREST